MFDRVDRTRVLQIAFLVVLAVAVAQVLYWLYDQAGFTRENEERFLHQLESDERVARELLELGAESERVTTLLPDVVVDGGGARLRPQALAQLVADRESRLNRYLWEGGFFLAVLISGMGVSWWALRREAELRGRQQNFLAAVSHELKSPLASLRLASETMAGRDLDNEARSEWLRRSLGDIDRLESLVSNLLESSRLESTEVDLHRQVLNLRSLAESVLGDYSERGDVGSQPAALRVRNQIPSAIELTADPIATETIVRNLVENACKAASPAGTVSLSARAEQARVVLVVEDDGVGFEPAESERLFKKFYRPGDEMRRSSRGTGLGLYLVRRFIELEGGSVSGTSEGPGRGARFVAEWPAR